MATRDHTAAGGSAPSFKDVIDDNAPYIGAMYVLNLVLFLAFVDLGGLLAGRLEYTTLLSPGEGTAIISMAGASAFALGFVAATLLALFYAISIFQNREQLDDYALEERISTITVIPAIQLFAVILCPVVTGFTLAQGIQFLPQIVGALL